MAEEKKEEDDWDPYKVDKAMGRRMEVAQMRFRLSCDDDVVPAAEKAQLKESMLGQIKAEGASLCLCATGKARASAPSAGSLDTVPVCRDGLSADISPLYESLCKQHGWSVDAKWLEEMKPVAPRRGPAPRVWCVLRGMGGLVGATLAHCVCCVLCGLGRRPTLRLESRCLRPPNPDNDCRTTRTQKLEQLEKTYSEVPPCVRMAAVVASLDWRLGRAVCPRHTHTHTRHTHMPLSD